MSSLYRPGLLAPLFGRFLADVSTGPFSTARVGVATLGTPVGVVGVPAPE